MMYAQQTLMKSIMIATVMRKLKSAVSHFERKHLPCTSLWREAPRQTLTNQACLREYGCFTPPQPLMKWGARLNHNTYAMQLLCGSLCRGVNPPQSWDGKHYKQWCSNDHIRSILSHFMIKEWAILMNKMYLIHL